MTDQSYLKPQTGLIVCVADDYRNFSEQTLVEFYQPILGANAFSLLFGLKEAMLPNPTLTKRISHAKLLSHLGLDMKDVSLARHRLEGLGLLKTFETTDQLGSLVVYELQATLTPSAFLRDDLLSVLLLEAVGETRVGELVKSATQFQLDKERLTPATKTFFDSFHVNADQITDPPAIIRESRQRFVVDKPENHALPATEFDFKLLLQLLSSQPISADEIQKYRQLILTEHVLYGIDETQMARIVMQATSVATNQLDQQRLKKIITTSYSTSQPVQSVNYGENVPTEKKPKSDSRESVSVQATLSKNEQQLVAACEAYAPMDFLKKLMVQKGGFVPESSRWILQHLIERGALNKSVINMLIYYVMQEKNLANLNQNLVDTVANSWAQAGVTDATGALMQIKQRQQRVTTGSNQRTGSKSRPQRRQVRETLPDWAKEGYQDKKQKMSSAEVAKIKARLEKLKKQQESEG